MRDLNEWVRTSAFEANLNIVKYAVFVAMVEWSRTWAFLQPLGWAEAIWRVVAWGGFAAAVALRFFLYYGVEKPYKAELARTEGA